MDVIVDSSGDRVPCRPTTRGERTLRSIGCVFIASFFAGLQRVVAHAAGPGFGPLLILFSGLTLGVSAVALSRLMEIWWPESARVEWLNRAVLGDLTLTAIVASMLVGAGILGGTLAALGWLP
ncbi:MAG: hypothetical protein AB8G96_09840 [Phycisphaerales bacterium]